jgi:hypothetical protein
VLTICAVADCLHYWFFRELEFDIAAETGAVVDHFDDCVVDCCACVFGGGFILCIMQSSTL